MIKVAALSRLMPLLPIPRERCIRMCEDAVAAAAAAGCDAVLLPELFDSFGSLETAAEPGADRSALLRAAAEPIPGPMTERLGALCAKHGIFIIACYAELDGERMYNTAVMLDRRGRIAGKYRKTHLCGGEGRCMGLSAGDELPVFETELGRVGIAICMDLYFPEVFRVLSLKGAQLIFWPHQTYGPSEETILVQARCRAIDSGCYFVGANFASPDYYAPYEPGHAFTGRAFIINPDGVLLADTGHAAGLAIASFDPSQPRKTKDVVCIRKSGVDLYAQDLRLLRRPELYGEIVRNGTQGQSQPADQDVFQIK